MCDKRHRRKPCRAIDYRWCYVKYMHRVDFVCFLTCTFDAMTCPPKKLWSRDSLHSSGSQIMCSQTLLDSIFYYYYCFLLDSALNNEWNWRESWKDQHPCGITLHYLFLSRFNKMHSFKGKYYVTQTKNENGGEREKGIPPLATLVSLCFADSRRRRGSWRILQICFDAKRNVWKSAQFKH